MRILISLCAAALLSSAGCAKHNETTPVDQQPAPGTPATPPATPPAQPSPSEPAPEQTPPATTPQATPMPPENTPSATNSPQR